MLAIMEMNLNMIIGTNDDRECETFYTNIR